MIGAAPRAAACSRACAEQDGDQQRLLLAGRALRRPACRCRHGRTAKIGAVRADMRRRRLRHHCRRLRQSARAARPRRRAPASLAERRLDRRPHAPAAPAGKARRPRRRRRRSSRSADVAPRRRDGDAVRAPCSLRARRARTASCGPLAQQLRALAQRLLVGGERVGMLGIEAVAPAGRGSAAAALAPSMKRRSICGVSQTKLDMLGQRRPGSARRRAVDAHDAALAAARSSASRPVPICDHARRRSTAAATAQSVRGARPPRPRRSISPSWARRRPRPGARKEIASSRLVLPAPFGPVEHHRLGRDIELQRARSSGNRLQREPRTTGGATAGIGAIASYRDRRPRPLADPRPHCQVPSGRHTRIGMRT